MAFDTDADRGLVGKRVREVLAAAGPLKVVSPYVSGNCNTLLGITNRRHCELTVICDIHSGNCDPRVLKALVDNGADVLTNDRVHAKVYVSSSGVVIGSANLSPNGLDRGTIEAAAVFGRGAARQAAINWIHALERGSDDAAPLLQDRKTFARLLSAWRARARRGGKAGAAKLTFLEALEQRSPLLDDCVVVMFLSVDRGLGARTVRREAKSQHVLIPEGDAWDYYTDEWDDKLAAFSTRALVRSNKTMITLKVKGTSARISSFAKFYVAGEKCLGIVRHNETMATVVAAGVRLPFQMTGTDEKRLLARLNAHPSARQTLCAARGWLVQPSVLADLLI